jgi:hypothetical protein
MQKRALQHSLVADVLAVEHVHAGGLCQLHAVVAEGEGVVTHAAVRVVPLHAAATEWDLRFAGP